MKRFTGILLIVLLVCTMFCSCTGDDEKKTAENQNELSEFLKDKMIVYYLDDGSIVCYSQIHSGKIPGKTENTYYRYFPENNTYVGFDEGPKLFALSGDIIDVNGKKYEECQYYPDDGSDMKSGYREFAPENNTFRIIGEDEEIYKSLSASDRFELSYDVKYTDPENYYYIVDEYKADGTYRSYYRHYDKDGNLLRSLKLPETFNDVREEYGSFTKMMVMGKYLYLEIGGVSYSAVLEIKENSLKVISKGFNGGIALGYDPVGGGNPVLYEGYSEDNNCSIFDIQTGKSDKFEIKISDGKGEDIAAVWQNRDSVLVRVSEDTDKTDHGVAYYIIPTEELPFTKLGDENTLYFPHKLR